jgi:hypothetical protein
MASRLKNFDNLTADHPDTFPKLFQFLATCKQLNINKQNLNNDRFLKRFETKSKRPLSSLSYLRIKA